MMRTLSAGLLLGMGALGGAAAQVNPENQVIGLNGTCEAVSLPNGAASCVGKGIIYMHLANGVVMLQVPLSEGRMLAFVGEKDSQPNPREYHLYLSRARIETRGTSYSAQLAGQCVIRMTTDGRIWHRADCDATDEHDKAYRLRFASNGQPVQVMRSRLGR